MSGDERLQSAPNISGVKYYHYLTPVLLAIYPPLFLYNQNHAMFPPTVLLTPLLVFAISALVLTALLHLIIRNSAVAILISSFFFLCLYLCGLTIQALPVTPVMVGISELKIDRLVFYLFCAIFLGLIALVVRRKRIVRPLLRLFLAMALVLASYQSVFALAHLWPTLRTVPSGSKSVDNFQSKEDSRSENQPHIFYIVLDGYGRADVLQDLYGHDDSQFLDILREHGFYVASQSRSNYSQTVLSVTSTLNMTYLNELADSPSKQDSRRGPLLKLLQENRVQRALQKQGYSFVSFASGYYATEFRNADLYISTAWDLGQFWNAILNITPLYTVYSLFHGELKLDFGSLQRRRIQNALKRLPALAKYQTPLFVFAHIIAPHPPFVFASDGSPVTQKQAHTMNDGNYFMNDSGLTLEAYRQLYRGQVQFLNLQIPKLIEQLFQKKSREVIIVLQGDHGPGSLLDQESFQNTDLRERLGILNAYYFPRQNYQLLYEEISPVNTFRIIFNDYFEGNYPLLPDQSYYSPFNKPYQFHEIQAEQLSIGEPERPSQGR